mmetsp:Transcript_8744/g.16086  ORF Transcript_8744/g.16086 Transcript_8744/m.16086 type:complete len:255 (-) Transcript_8744:139-903(-)
MTSSRADPSPQRSPRRDTRSTADPTPSFRYLSRTFPFPVSHPSGTNLDLGNSRIGAANPPPFPPPPPPAPSLSGGIPVHRNPTVSETSAAWTTRAMADRGSRTSVLDDATAATARDPSSFPRADSSGDRGESTTWPRTSPLDASASSSFAPSWDASAEVPAASSSASAEAAADTSCHSISPSSSSSSPLVAAPTADAADDEAANLALSFSSRSILFLSRSSPSKAARTARPSGRTPGGSTDGDLVRRHDRRALI